MLQNVIGGLQGVIDHALVGHYVGYAGNAAIGVSLQIYLVVIAFISSLFIGMSVLVARFVGARDPVRVNRTVLQAFLVAVGLSVGVLAPIGYFAAPALLSLVNAAPNVQAEALPFLRIMFVFGVGMLLFYMVGGALRSAGDARTPLRLGIAVTALNITFNVILIQGLGPFPALGTSGAAIGTAIATGSVALYSAYKLWSGSWVVRFPRGEAFRIEWDIVRALFRFGLPSGVQGVAMNVGGVMLLGFIGSLAMSGQAQAAYAVGYTELFSLITWTSAGLTGAVATVAGQSLGSGNADRAQRSAFEAHADCGDRCRSDGAPLRPHPATAARPLRDDRANRRGARRAAPALPQRLRGLRCRGPHLHRWVAGDGRHAQSAVHLPRLADRDSAGDLLARAALLHARPVGHLARDPRRPRDALPPLDLAFQAGAVARDQRRHPTDARVSVGRAMARRWLRTQRGTPAAHRRARACRRMTSPPCSTRRCAAASRAPTRLGASPGIPTACRSLDSSPLPAAA
jgi:putative MATE family efflux protein